MKHLLDVNILLAAIWAQHPQHDVTFMWLTGKEIVVCPLAELGFLRISTQKKVFNVPMSQTRDLLKTFIAERNATRIADDSAILILKSGEAVG